MNKECYTSGSCIKCGCDTPNLQMANAGCKGNCYKAFVEKKKWEIFKDIWKKHLPNRDTKRIAELLRNQKEPYVFKQYPTGPEETYNYITGFDPINK
jgi:hypothetical protein